jgi:phosphatidylglycerol---prolipoprotein diacylglyceryl transferase
MTIGWLVTRIYQLRVEGAIDWKQSWGQWSFAAFLVAFVLPIFESKVTFIDSDPVVLGIPIRGYGVLLVCAILAGCYWTAKRGERFGVTGDTLFQLAPWGMVGGLLGARLFYVIQKWSELPGESFIARLSETIKFWEGGLVVYGGMIGGLIATSIWCYRNGRSFLMFADIVTPAFLIGLALGRLGCLLNGCCYGAVCLQATAIVPTIQFPPGSPPFMDQLQSGELVDAKLGRPEGKPTAMVVKAMKPDGWLQQNDIQIGNGVTIETRTDLERPASAPEVSLRAFDGFRYKNIAVPDHSLPVYPSQVYASINAVILSCLLASIALVYRNRGFVFGLGMILYGFSRIIEEFIRIDEAGQFGTIFSIGQWVSFLGVLAGLVILVIVLRRNEPKTQSPIAFGNG